MWGALQPLSSTLVYQLLIGNPPVTNGKRETMLYVT